MPTPTPILSGTTNIFMDGVAAYLAAHEVGDYTDPYTPHADDANTVIDLRMMAPDPDRAVCVTAYLVDAYPDRPLDQANLQIRSRGTRDDLLDGDRLGDQCFDLLQGLVGMIFGPLEVLQILFKSSIPMGIDASNRAERSDNYVVDLNTAPSALRPS